MLINGKRWRWPYARALATVCRRTPLRPIRLNAVVGSFGKTTTARAVATALGIRPERITDRNEFTHVATALLSTRPCDRPVWPY